MEWLILVLGVASTLICFAFPAFTCLMLKHKQQLQYILIMKVMDLEWVWDIQSLHGSYWFLHWLLVSFPLSLYSSNKNVLWVFFILLASCYFLSFIIWSDDDCFVNKKKKLNEQLIRLCFCLRFFFLGFFFRKTKNSRRILFKSSQLTIGVDLGSINIHKISLNMAILTNQTNKITNTLIALSKHSLYSSSFFKVK